MADKKVSSIVKKSNVLCRASWSPQSVWEARLVALVASKIKLSDKDFHTYEIKLTDIIKEKDKGGANYKIIDKTTDYSMTRLIKVHNDKTGGWDKYNLFSRCSYNPKLGTITVRFDPDLKPHYLNLQKHFARYDLTQFLLLPSTYSQRLYEILKSWDDRSDCEIDLPDLHIMLDVPETFKKNFAFFRRRVLDKAFEDIHKHTSLKFEWEPIKKGRKVTAIRFVFAKKRAEKAAAKQKHQAQQQTSKHNNKYGKMAIDCYQRCKGACKEDQSQSTCKLCKEMFPR